MIGIEDTCKLPSDERLHELHSTTGICAQHYCMETVPRLQQLFTVKRAVPAVVV